MSIQPEHKRFCGEIGQTVLLSPISVRRIPVQYCHDREYFYIRHHAGGSSMFDSLADRMKEDDAKVTTNKERIVRYITVLLISAVVFGGLYFGVSALQ